jgi:hypothetical protein
MLAARGKDMEVEVAEPQKRKWNWRIWVGFLIALAALPSYLLIFARYPVTRNVPWATWLMFVLAGWLLCTGVRKAFAKAREYRGKIIGSVFGVLTLAAAGLFGFGTLYATRQLPGAGNAPKVGDKALEFALADTNGKIMALSALLTEPILEGTGAGVKPRGVLLIFYRGYW